MSEFPLEIWSKIVSFAEFRTLLSCCQVSKSLARLASRYLCRTLYYSQDGGNIRNISSLIAFLAKRSDLVPTIEDLRIQTGQLESVSSLFKKLQSDHGCVARLAKLLIHVATQDTSSLVLPHSHLTRFHNPLDNLTDLSIIGPATLHPIIASILMAAPNTTRLILISTSGPPLQLARRYTEAMTKLMHLELQNIHQCTIKDILLSSASCLEGINLQDCQSVQAAGLRLPNLRQICVEEGCEVLMAATPAISALSIFEEHRPLEYFNRFAAACSHIEYLRVCDNPFSHFEEGRRELARIIEAQALPKLQHLETGCWGSLRLLLPHLPSTLNRIDLYELEFAYCPFILRSISHSLSRPSHLKLALNILVEDSYPNFIAVKGYLNGIPIPRWLHCHIWLEDALVWEAPI